MQPESVRGGSDGLALDVVADLRAERAIGQRDLLPCVDGPQVEHGLDGDCQRKAATFDHGRGERGRLVEFVLNEVAVRLDDDAFRRSSEVQDFECAPRAPAAA